MQCGMKNYDRDLHLSGLPVQLRMGFDAYKESSNYTPRNQASKSSAQRRRLPEEGQVSDAIWACCSSSRQQYDLLHRRLRPVREEGRQDNLRPLSGIWLWLARRIDSSTFDVMNSNTTNTKQCSNIDSPNHTHMYELLDYVKSS